jgi:hypothetical protein
MFRFQSLWRSPDGAAVITAARLLKETLNESTTIIMSCFERLKKDSKEGGISKKTADEEISGALCVLYESLRGVTEILGDRISTEGRSPGSGPFLIHLAGEKSVNECADPEVKTYLSSVREEIVQFLVNLHHSLDPGTARSNILTGSSDVDCVSFSDQNLTLTPDIANAWLQVFESLIINRTSYSKDTKAMRMTHGSQKRQMINSTARYTLRYLDRIEKFVKLEDESTAERTRRESVREYWKYYDQPSYFVSESALIQHCIRAKELSHAAVRLTEHVDGKIVFICLLNIFLYTPVIYRCV